MAYNPKDFGYKDSLPSGNPEKVVKGADLDNEFQAIKRELDALDDELHPGGGDGDLVHEPPNTGKNYVRQGGTATWKEIGTEFINDTNFVSEDPSKDLGAESKRWNKLWTNEVDASGNVNVGGDVNVDGSVDIGGNINVDGNASIDGALEIHGNIIIDGGQVVDPDGNPAGGVGAGNSVGDVPKWNGSEWVPTFYKTNDLNDVQSATASKDQFLIHNGSQWIAEDFHVDTTLVFQGAVDLTGTAPQLPANGDLYINDTDGVVDASWGQIAGKSVLAGNAVGFSSAKSRWYLLGDISSTAVTQVREGDCIDVDSSEPSRPVVGLALETQTDIDLGVEAHSWGNHAGDISNLQGQINQEVKDREDGDADLQGQIDALVELEGGDVSSLINALNQEIQDREEGDQALQNQINQEIQDRIDGDLNLQGQINQEILDRESGDAALQGQIDQNKTDISDNTNAINDLKNEFDNHDHTLDDLSDVNAGSPTRDDLIIWNGANWVADDFSFIQTALRFKGGIAPTAAAPTSPEGGDLYVFESDGTISGSWGVIAGRVVQAGKFVGYAAGSNNRWFLLGDMAEIGVAKVSPGLGIDVNDSKPSEPVVSVDRTEVDKWYEPKFSKNTAFNKNFGTAAGTVAEGNHNHTGTYEPVINPKNTAFNKNFAGSGSATTVSRSDHTHSQYLTDFTETDPTVPQHVKNISATQISNWDTAYGWGNHATQGYLKSGDIPNTDLSNYYTKTESDGKYEPKFAKNSAFNKDFGTTSTTVSRGDHAHSQYLTSSNLTGYATEAWVTSGFQPKGNYALVGASYTKAESDNKYALSGASYTKAESDNKYELKGQGGGALPDGDWHCTGSITAAGNITAYSTSDERLKDDITAMPVGLIDGISPVTWKWKEGGKKSGGVVAQQLEQCGLGNWVHEAPDGTLGVDYNALIGVLLSEVKSLKDRVKELEK